MKRRDKNLKIIRGDQCGKHEPFVISDVNIPIMVKCRESGRIVSA